MNIASLSYKDDLLIGHFPMDITVYQSCYFITHYSWATFLWQRLGTMNVTNRDDILTRSP